MAFETELEDIQRIDLFAAFELGALRDLIFSSETRLLRAGDTLFRRGEASDGGYLLTAGSVAIEARDPAKPAEKILRPVALLGETALVASTTRPATALAREPSTVLKIPRTLFHQILEKHPATATLVRQFFRDRLSDFSQHLKMNSDS